MEAARNEISEQVAKMHYHCGRLVKVRTMVCRKILRMSQAREVLIHAVAFREQAFGKMSLEVAKLLDELAWCQITLHK